MTPEYTCKGPGLATQLKFCQYTYNYCTWENFDKEKLANLMNRELAIHQDFPHQYSQIHHKCIWYMQ